MTEGIYAVFNDCNVEIGTNNQWRKPPVPEQPMGRGGSRGQHRLDADTEALCQRLELKAKNLTKFGQGFHKENRGICVLYTRFCFVWILSGCKFDRNIHFFMCGNRIAI